MKITSFVLYNKLVKDIGEIIGKKSVKKVMLIFPHPDDESFVSAGLLLSAEKYNVDTHLVCLTSGGKGKNSLGGGNLAKIREGELDASRKILGIDNLTLLNYPDAELRKTKAKWTKDIRKLIKDYDADVIVTFDYSGITGHPDHIVCCHEVFKIIKKVKRKTLLWRSPTKDEIKQFDSNDALKFASIPTHVCEFGFGTAIKKLKAIFAHKSQMPSYSFRLHLIEQMLFHHEEHYHKVDLKKKYNFKFVDFKI